MKAHEHDAHEDTHVTWGIVMERHICDNEGHDASGCNSRTFRSWDL
jgi:hypothetical protein